jgi:transposase
MSLDDSLPTDLASAHALIIVQRQALIGAKTRATAAESEAQYRALLIEKLKLTIRKLRHDRFGQSSERGALLDQLELQLADLEVDAAQADTAAQIVAAAASTPAPSFERRRPARRPLPDHLPRERIVYPAPSACPCCGGTTLRKIGEDVTETLELIPRQWKVIQHVREKFSCRACEAISQPPAPSHPIARGVLDRSCLPTSCSPSMACICRPTDKVPSMGGKVSISTYRRWPTGSARQRRR